jgi:hypothetical protein
MDIHVINQSRCQDDQACRPTRHFRQQLKSLDRTSADDLLQLHERLVSIESRIEAYVKKIRYIPQQRDDRTGG